MKDKILYIFFILIAFLLTDILIAQVNIESIRKKELREGINGAIMLNLKYASGNSEYIILNPELRFDYYKKSYHTFIIGSLNRGEESKKIFINDGFLHWRYILHQHNIIATEFFTQIEYNDFIKLKNRSLAGTGLRIVCKEEDNKFKLYAGIGMMYEYENYSDPDEGKKKLFRSTNYISAEWLIDSRLFFSIIGYYQFAVKKVSDFRILIANSINLSISKIFSIDISVDYRFDNQPALHIKKYDLGISNGFIVSF